MPILEIWKNWNDAFEDGDRVCNKAQLKTVT